jgi:hypothetical protein
MAIAACFVFQRETSRSVFWDFFDSIGQNRQCSDRAEYFPLAPKTRHPRRYPLVWKVGHSLR